MIAGTVTQGGNEATRPSRDTSWESLSSDELRTIVERGAQGGELFYGASRELQRRAAVATSAAEEAEAAALRGKQRQTQIVLVVLAAILMVATVFELFGGL